ncbi:hypothetical protein ACU5JM_01600 (plasmid) [Rhodococcus erythropolis]|uniref:hypothetical protein n=1 Tax=Rhodococcus erythropolis TaxID=1833 RepID=UPI00406BBB27
MICTALAVTLSLAGCSTQNGETASPADSPRAATAVEEKYTETYIDGVVKPEDLVTVPGTPWVLVSSMASKRFASPGYLAAVNSTDLATKEVWPSHTQRIDWDEKAYPDCAGVPDATSTEPHGITVRPGEGDSPSTLFAINHKRESVEAFRIDADSSDIGLTWIGCIPLPADASANGIASLPDNSGIAVTSMFDPTQPGNPFERMFTGADTGRVIKWTPAAGWAPVPGTELGGANGVLVSPDGQSVIAAAWTQRKVVKVSTNAPYERLEMSIPFLPDNLRWTERGTVLLTGHEATMDDILTCNAGEGTDCPTGYSVIEIDPTTMTSTVAVDAADSETSIATTAVSVGDEIWVGSLNGDRITRLQPK